MATVKRRFESRMGKNPCATNSGDTKYWITETDESMKQLTGGENWKVNQRKEYKSTRY